MDMEIQFTFEDTRFKIHNTNTDAEFNVIVLPDGRLLRMTSWFEAFVTQTNPPVITANIIAGDVVANATQI